MALTEGKILTTNSQKTGSSSFLMKRSKQLFFQPKLTVGPTDDPYEREADVVADQVMRKEEPEEIQTKAIDVQRKCAQCEEEQPLQRKDTGDHESESDTPSLVNEAINSAGHSMDNGTASFMENRFGYDFSHVKIHTDNLAAKSAQSINALAYTSHNNIVFNEGQYSPGTENGKKLLAHELTHVVQQGNGIPLKNNIQTYRPNSGVNFGANDGGGLTEQTFTDKKKQPYIEKITVKFTSTKPITNDSGVSEDVPTGKLSATYASNIASPPANITGAQVVGGFPRSGLTDKDTNMAVSRIEGWGYHHLAVPKADRVGSKWPKSKYYKPSLADANATMSYALFFRGKQAIHYGADDHGSLACVHVSDVSTMRRLNYHTRADITKVDVDYDAATLKKACCQRFDEKGYMVSNPCGKEDSKKCP